MIKQYLHESATRTKAQGLQVSYCKTQTDPTRGKTCDINTEFRGGTTQRSKSPPLKIILDLRRGVSQSHKNTNSDKLNRGLKGACTMIKQYLHESATRAKAQGLQVSHCKTQTDPTRVKPVTPTPEFYGGTTQRSKSLF
jgi:hypothetical protein